MKPVVSCTITGSLSSAEQNALSSWRVCSEVSKAWMISTSFITGAGLKKCRPATRSRCLQTNHGGDRQRRGVGGQYRIGAADMLETLEQRLLHLQIFDDGFDDEIAIGNRGP